MNQRQLFQQFNGLDTLVRIINTGNGNPEKEIRKVRKPEIVFKNGVGYDSKKDF